MKKLVYFILMFSLFFLNGGVSIININEPSETVISGSVYIEKIMPSEAFAIAKIVLGGDNSYSVKITSDSDTPISAFFSGLKDEYIEISSYSGSWFFYKTFYPEMKEIYINTIPSPNSKIELEGIYYLYVGVDGVISTGVNINVIGTGSSAEIELLR